MAAFQFRQFAIEHDQCAMKVGTDGILLGAWTDVSGVSSILDVGTGCGLIALMCAQRNLYATLLGVEVDPCSAEQAAQNFLKSPWSERLKVINQPFQSLAGTSGPFDLIVCNPPFFNQGPQSPGTQRANARHANALPLPDLLGIAAELLVPTGRLSLILAADDQIRCQALAAEQGFSAVRRTHVRPLPSAPCRRVLLEFRRGNHAAHVNELTIESRHHDYTPDFWKLTGEFYLDRQECQ